MRTALEGKRRSSAKSVGKVGRMGGYRFGDDHAAAGRSCLQSIDLDRHQIRVQSAFQRGEPKDTHDERPQTPDFTQVPRGCGKPKANWFRKKDSGRGLRPSRNVRVIQGLANRPEVLLGRPTHQFRRPGEKEGVQAETLREENAAMKRPQPPCQARWKCRGRGKRGKPNCGFPRFPPPLGNRHRRDFHILTAPTTLPCSQNPKTRTPRPAPFGRPPQHDERRIHRPQRTNPAFDSSSSPRPGNQRPISGSCLDWKMLARKKLAGTVSGAV